MNVFISQTVFLLCELQPSPISSMMAEADGGQGLCVTELIALLASVPTFH